MTIKRDNQSLLISPEVSNVHGADETRTTHLTEFSSFAVLTPEIFILSLQRCYPVRVWGKRKESQGEKGNQGFPFNPIRS